MANQYGMTITVDAKSVNAMFTSLENVLADSSIESFLMGQTSDYIRDRVRSRFSGEGDDVTGPWQPLEASTARIRQAMGYGPFNPINVRTGDMQSYLLGDSGAITGSSTWEFPAPGAPPSIQDKLQTAQRGRAYPPTVPRPVLGVNAVDESYIVNDLESYIMAAI